MVCIRMIAELLEQVADVHQDSSEDRFISIGDISHKSMFAFLSKCVTYVKFSEEMFIQAVVLIDRLNDHAAVKLVHINKYNLFGIALMVSMKTQMDEYCYSNEHFAYVCDIEVNEFNGFERLFCELLQFSINITEDIHMEYEKEIAYCSSIGRVPLELLTEYDDEQSN